jgi:hypothetical protein
MMTRRQTAVAAIAGAIVVAVYLARLDRVAGMVVDDAWYVVLGQALARGEGLRLVSSATAAILPSVTPGFPAILALSWRFQPRFPDNVVLLKAASLAAMIVAGAATAWYGRRRYGWPWEIAGAVGALTAITPAFVFLATSTVMPECVFACAQLCAVVVIDRAADRERAVGAAIAGGALAGAAYLVKSSAVPLVAAGAIYVWLRRRRPAALAFVVVAIACVLPWQLYARAHAPTLAEQRAHGGSIAVPYGDSVRLRIAAVPSSGLATPADIADRIAHNVANVATHDFVGLAAPAMLRGASESGEEVLALGGHIGLSSGSMGNTIATEIVSSAIALLVLIGFARSVRTRASVAEILVPLSLALTVAVPFFTFRYVLPLAPFLFCYLVEGIRAFDRNWRIVRIVVLSLVALDVTDHAQYVALARTPSAVDWLADADDAGDTIRWLNGHLPQDAAVASSNPGLVYLDTGRKGVAIDDVETQRAAWRALGVHYVAALRPGPLPSTSAGEYQVLYRSARGRWIIRI